MSQRFVRCVHCRMPHAAAATVCPATGLPLPGVSRSSDEERPRRAAPAVVPTPDTAPPKRPEANRAPKIARPFREDLLGQIIGGRYRIKSVLGQGGMGTVFEAEHLTLGREVAIKVLNPTHAAKKVSVARFHQEAKAAGNIGHPNICAVYDLGEHEGSPYLAMEKLEGETFADRIAREQKLPLHDVCEVLLQVLAGLSAAHEKGVMHRDIKPENIFLAKRAHGPSIVKILDFGVSKFMAGGIGDGDDELSLTRTGMVMGTPYYMASEQARGERKLDGRVDVYATGVMLYEALTGKRPFLAPNYNALLLAILSATPKPLRDLRPDVPGPLEQIVARAMMRDREKRYPTAADFRRDLQAFAQTLPARPAAPAPPPPGPQAVAPAPAAPPPVVRPATAAREPEPPRAAEPQRQPPVFVQVPRIQAPTSVRGTGFTTGDVEAVPPPAEAPMPAPRPAAGRPIPQAPATVRDATPPGRVQPPVLRPRKGLLPRNLPDFSFAETYTGSMNLLEEPPVRPEPAPAPRGSEEPTVAARKPRPVLFEDDERTQVVDPREIFGRDPSLDPGESSKNLDKSTAAPQKTPTASAEDDWEGRTEIYDPDPESRGGRR